MKKTISIVVPCYNEEESLPIFFKEVKKIEKKMDYVFFEYVFVDDGSRDKTLEILRDLAKNNKNVRYVSFSRNFGKEAAMYAGLTYAKGDYITIMDADLHDPPRLIEVMYKGIVEEGYDCIGSRRVTRKGEPPVRSFFARCFYRIINRLSETEMISGARDFRLMTRKMVDSILSMKEYSRYSKGLFSFVGFKIKWLEYENVPRVAGQTKWSFFKLLKYAFEGIIAFSTKPLLFSLYVGLLFLLASLITLIVIIVRAVQNVLIGPVISLTCVSLFVGGTILVCMGILGAYLSKTYMEVKGRPVYIIRETEGDSVE